MSYWAGKTILLTGGHGFIGPYLRRVLVERGADPERIRAPRRVEADLRVLADCRRVIRGADVVIHAAAVVGGIEYNRTHAGDIYFDNMAMNTCVLEASYREGVGKVVAVSSACAYPLKAPVPLREESFYEGEPEPTNSPYGYAKRMLGVQARCYRQQYGMATAFPVPFNAYGPGDDFDPSTSHVIPALIRKCHEQKELVVWGTGKPTRNFLHAEDFARGVVLAGEVLDDPDPINIGTDEETSIRELVEMIVEITGFSGPVRWDASKPDGQPKRAADISRARGLLGYEPRVRLREGLVGTVAWYRTHGPGKGSR